MAGNERTLLSLGSFGGSAEQQIDPPSPRALWARLRRLEKLPHPLMHPDENERTKTKAEWLREIPSIIGDLFYEVRFVLGDEQAREFFKAAAKRERKRPKNRTFDNIARDIYVAAEKNGVPKENLISWVADRMGAVSTERDLNALRRRVARAVGCLRTATKVR
jgi:hypothetical protein